MPSTERPRTQRTPSPRARLGGGALAALAVVLLAPRPARAQVAGVVVDAVTQAPIAGAEVTLRATTTTTTTDASGAFSLPGAVGNGIHVVAAKPGYWNQGVIVSTPAGAQTIALTAVPQDDNPNYAFLDPGTCGFCHPNQYSEWLGAPMAHAGTNTWVYDLFNGQGTPGGMGGFVYVRDSVHAAKDPNSECRACHQPEPWVAEPWTALGDPATTGAKHGVSCEICHKAAHIDESKPNFPGIWPGVVTITRPSDASHQVEYGVLDDVDFEFAGLMRASFQPQLSAALCAACHEDKNDPDEDLDFEEPNGVVSEPTYEEWLASPYADPNSPKHATCATCHMPPMGKTHVCEAAQPPIERDPSTIRAHDFRGTTAEYLEHAVSLTVSAEVSGEELVAQVSITNDQTGHSVPTGVTVRNMILLVEAEREEDHAPLAHLGAQTIDDIGGVGDPTKGYFAGLPGKVYAKHNVDQNGNGPVFYTEATAIASDDRIAPLATDVTTYPFAIPMDGGTLRVRARLVYRRALRALVDAKGWTTEGHGAPLEDLAPPNFGHLMAEAEAVVALPCDAGVCVDAGAGDAGFDAGDDDAGFDASAGDGGFGGAGGAGPHDGGTGGAPSDAAGGAGGAGGGLGGADGARYTAIGGGCGCQTGAPDLRGASVGAVLALALASRLRRRRAPKRAGT